MSIEILDTSLDYAVQNVRRFAPSRAWHGQKNGGAAWSVGNCLITVRAVTEVTSELELVPFRKVPADNVTNAVWVELVNRLRGAGIAHPCQDLERVARKSLSTMHKVNSEIARYKKDPEQYKVAFMAEWRETWGLPGLPPVTEHGLWLAWRKHVYDLAWQSRELRKTNQERAALAHKTPQQAAEEFFETLASAASDAPISPTSGAALGDGQGKKEQAGDVFTVKYLAHLRQDIVEHFDDSDLRDLCFDMGIDYDDLPGQSKKDKARELVARCKRTGKIRELVALCRKLHSNVSWEDVPEAASDR